MLKIPFLHYVLNFVTMFVKGFCSKQNAHHHDSGLLRKMLRATCVISVLLGAFTLPTTSFAWNSSTSYVCGNNGDFPMSFAGCKSGYYYEDLQNATSALTPDEVGECIACPSGYRCTGGFAGAKSITPYEYEGGSSRYDCGVGHFPMFFGGCKAGYYYEDWQSANDMLHPDEVGECIACPAGHTCAGGFAGPVEDYVPKFTITTTYDTDIFTFSMSAAGTFIIDWGDGTFEEIDRTDDTQMATYSHDYDSAGRYVIGFAGLATEYDSQEAAISFSYGKNSTASNIASISGSLGAIFPTLPGDANDSSRYPRFVSTFADATNLKYLPTDSNGNSTLFSGVSGAADYMFNYTFSGCYSLKSIPYGLFSGVSGAAQNMFDSTFYNTRIKSIPADLFSGVSGAADHMFYRTFYECSDLKSIPYGLFSGVSGAADSMFRETFHHTSIKSIPADLFAGVSGAADNMFYRTFDVCYNLTSVPADLFAGVSGTPKPGMFNQTFQYDYSLNEFRYGNDNSTTSYIPPHFFGSIATTPYAADFMRNVFNGTGIATSCPAGTDLYTTGFESYWNGKVSCITRTPFTIKFDLNNGSWPTGVVVPQQYTETGSTVTLPTPKRFGYIFMGWYDNSEFNGHAITNTFGLSDDKTFYAKWEVAKFTITTTDDTDSFKFSMSAAGTFWVDWGDGTIEEIDRTDDTEPTTYSHDYDDAGEYVIGFTGLATEYNDYDGYFDDVNFAAISFGTDEDWFYQHTPGNIASISGSLGAMFPTLPGDADDLSKHPRFPATFAHAENLTLIPSTLFSGVSGAVSYMFDQTFLDCTSLTSLPSGLFSGVSGAANSMFYSTFDGCSSLTSIPSGLFSGVSGAANSMFGYTFYGCSSLESIPSGLFSGVSGAASRMFEETFNGCSGLTSLPSGLFSGVSGAADYMFGGTFSGCTSLTSLPSGLFSGVSGAADSMFSGTFYGCTSLTSLPSGLFSGVSGAADSMFTNTFNGCSSLTSIPSGLFSGVSGAANSMFYNTFSACSSLESIPADLFAGVSGTPEEGMFYATFQEDVNLDEFYYGDNSTTSYIPPHFFGSMATTPSANNFMTEVFYNTGIATSCPSGTTLYTTGFESYWNGKVSCLATYNITFNMNEGSWPVGVVAPQQYTEEDTVTLPTPTRDGYIFTGWYDNSAFTGNAITEIPSGSIGNKTFYAKWETPKFTLTTTSNTNSFQFQISAAGNFYVDCGDGGTLTDGNGDAVSLIIRDNVNEATYTCSWSSADAHTIKFTGNATGYSPWLYSAIRFSLVEDNTVDSNAMKIASISGSLGQIFGTVENPTIGQSQPKFYRTFRTAKNMIGTNIPDPNYENMNYALPPTLFDGVYGQPIDYMFLQTFQSCSGLTGSIPGNLFAGISGAPVESMFDGTFIECRSLTGSIPGNLFAGISGAPARTMFWYTFWGCSGLSGSIPGNLFAGISGAPARSMYGNTFAYCTGLTGPIPSGLFGNISGAPAYQMFYETFYYCSGLTGSIPGNLFAGISGAPATRMFYQTFRFCSGLTGYIPSTLFAGISTESTETEQMTNVFANSELATTCPSGTELYTTGFESYFNGKVSCVSTTPYNITFNLNGGSWPTGVVVPQQYTEMGSPVTLPTPTREGYVFAGWYDNAELNGRTIINTSELSGNKTFYAKWEVAKFSITTIDGTDSFQFQISAAGNFYVDCGDGGTLTDGNGDAVSVIIRDNVDTSNLYICSWSSAGAHTIGFAGNATGYADDNSPAIWFSFLNRPRYKEYNSNKIDSISGSLGQIFGTVENPTIGQSQPRFYQTFRNATELTALPTDSNGNSTLFSGVSGAADWMFYETFRGCSVTSIPSGLFSGVSGAANYMFYNTFAGCRGLTSLPSGLFSGVSGAAESMFYQTFSECSALESIPSGLFSGVSGAADSMFTNTFNGCSSLTSIPSGLFSGVSGAANYMFYQTFYNCTSLTSIPADLFAGVSGTPEEGMFYATFQEDVNLNEFRYSDNSTSSYIPPHFFGSIATTPDAESFMTDIFEATGIATSCPSGTTQYTTGFESYWDDKVSCVPAYTITFNMNDGSWPVGVVAPQQYTDTDTVTLPTPTRENYYFAGWYDNSAFTGNAITEIPSGSTGNKTFYAKWTAFFAITTTPDTNFFKFGMSAAGTFTIDWGDGTIEVIDRTGDTDIEEYDHDYDRAGQYVITFTGLATGYNDSGYYSDEQAPAAISFGKDYEWTDDYTADKIASVSGSLGAVFPTLNDGSDDLKYQPRFLQTFINATNLTSIPSGLFSGVSGAATEMFENTFGGCSGLTSIPSGLFSGVSGAAERMFYATFNGCTSLTSLPTDSNGNSTLFGDVSGAENSLFSNTFYGCTSLTSLPSGLFSGVSGAAHNMFHQTFAGCTSLTSLPSGLFGGVSGAANSMFADTFRGCTSLTSLPTDSNGNSTLFSGIEGAANYMFSYTFDGCTSLESIPTGLFSGVSGAANSMFADTFRGCTSLTSLPSGLFSGVSGAADYMFNRTFQGCTSLTSLPSGLFSGVSGAANYMFSYTFYGCTSLASLPTDSNGNSTLFSGVSGAADYMFNYTFNGCTSLTSLPSGLFSGVSGAANYMFNYTFNGCTSLTSLPTDSNGNSTLFSGVSGAANSMFAYTFRGCTSLVSLPSGLFSGVSGAANSMFAATFYGCSALTSLPTDSNGNSTLFGDVSGAATGLFSHTFYGCSALTSLPSGLFGGVSGTATYMFQNTFYGCSALTSIPANLFAGLSGNLQQSMFNGTFSGDRNLNEFYYSDNSTTSYIPPHFFGSIPSSNIARMSLSSVFYNTGFATSCPSGTVKYTTGFESYWNGKVSCTPTTAYNITFNLNDGSWPTGVVVPQQYTTTSTVTLPAPTREGYTFAGWYDNSEFTGRAIADTLVLVGDKTFYAKWNQGTITPKFTLTTVDGTDSFSFTMSAAGNFLVDCGDGGALTSTANDVSGGIVTRDNVDEATYKCSWSSAGAHTIRFAGSATGYPTTYKFSGGASGSAISFNLIPGESETNAQKIASISGSLGQIFGTVENPTIGQSQPRFHRVFYYAENMTGTDIPDPNNENMNYALPPTLFDGVYGQPIESMFSHTFQGCSGLTGSIPGNLFAGISGAPAEFMFSSTFYGCSGLSGSIPGNLFAGISGAPAEHMFDTTFTGCRNLTGSIPGNLFAGISGAPAASMFSSTFQGCSGLTGSIPGNLFAGISGAPAEHMFWYTFRSCSGLTGSIPGNLFAGISGAPAKGMFEQTFSYCGGLTGSIPGNLFAGISGAPAQYMFQQTFLECSGLTGYIPSTLFAGISTASTAQDQMYQVFYESGLDTLCPSGTELYTTGFESYFDGKVACASTTTYNITFNMNEGSWPTGVVAPQQYTETDTITLPTPKRFGYIFMGWYDNSAFTGNAITNTFGLSGNKTFYAKWETSKFTLTTVDGTDSFEFQISAAGNFLVDCGDGGALTSTASDVSGYEIIRDNLNEATYTCSWSSAGAHTIGFSGNATGYSTTDDGLAAITFYLDDLSNTEKIASISGSLGQIFGTVETPTIGQSQPRFYQTFLGASNMTGTNIPDPNNENMNYALPPTLFNGVYGQPTNDMFNLTFYYCSGLTGSIPSGLFGNLSGTPSEFIFHRTFQECSGLTGSIPSGLFGNLSGAPASNMFAATFQGCSGLTGSIPSGLFGSLSGEPAVNMFYFTFSGCSGLTGSIPGNLFTGVSGAPVKNIFNHTFYNCSGLTGYIQPSLFAGISTESTARNQMYSVFSGSGLDTYCPANTYQYTTGFESYFDGKVACEVCPEGGTSPAGSTSVNQCIAYCPVDHFVPENHPEMCFPHMLHVGDEVVYLSETRKTTPALNVLFDGNVFYANMTNAQTPMTSGSQHYFKAKYNDEIYYIYDDTLSGESE